MREEYTPPASLLRGLSVKTARMFGMPCIGATYESSHVRSNRLEGGALCAFCRARATNAHHVPHLGMGARNASFTLRGHKLRPALIALCGSGTTGCHGACHSGLMGIEWVWDSPDVEKEWWDGKLLDAFGPASPELFEFGCWVISRDGGSVVRRIRA